MKKFLLKKLYYWQLAGFSLMEVMISTAILSGSALVVTQITENSNKATNEIKGDIATQVLLTEVANILKSPEACKLNFLNLNPKDNGVAITDLKDGKNMTFIKAGCASGMSATAINLNNSTFTPCVFKLAESTLYIKEMKLHQFENPSLPYSNGANHATFSIQIIRSLNNIKNIGTSTASTNSTLRVVETRMLPVRLVVESNKVTSCQDPISFYKTGACNALGGNPTIGTGIYDQADGFCKNVVLKHSTSTSGIGSDWGNNALTVDGKLKVTNDAQIDGHLTVKNGLTAEKGILIKDGEANGKDLVISDKVFFSDINRINSVALLSMTNTTLGSLILGNNTSARITGNNGNIGINNDSPAEKLDVGGNLKWGTGRGLLTTNQQASIELGGPGGVTPFIDFTRTADTTDYDARIRLTNNDLLEIEGASLQVQSGFNVFINGRPVATQDWVSAQFTTKLGDKAKDQIIDALISGTAAVTGASADLNTFKQKVCESISQSTWTGGTCILHSGRSCPAGEKLVGFNSDGSINCKAHSATKSCAAGFVVNGVTSTGDLSCVSLDLLYGGAHKEQDCYDLSTSASVINSGGKKFCMLYNMACPKDVWTSDYFVYAGGVPRTSVGQVPGTFRGRDDSNDTGCCFQYSTCGPFPSLGTTYMAWTNWPSSPSCTYAYHSAADSTNNDEGGTVDGSDAGCANETCLHDNGYTGSSNARVASSFSQTYFARESYSWVLCH